MENQTTSTVIVDMNQPITYPYQSPVVQSLREERQYNLEVVDAMTRLLGTMRNLELEIEDEAGLKMKTELKLAEFIDKL